MSGPLVRNRIMGAFAFLRGSRDGFVTDVDHPDHSLGSEDTWAGRGQMRFVFGPRSELLVSGDYARSQRPHSRSPGRSPPSRARYPSTFQLGLLVSPHEPPGRGPERSGRPRHDSRSKWPTR